MPQVRNAGQVGLLTPDLQARYEPNFAWACGGAYRQLMGLRGWWSMGSVSELQVTYDGSGQGRHLSQSGDPQWICWDLAPCVSLLGGDWLYRADEAGLDTLGADTFHTADLGMTVGCWVYFTRAPGATEVVMSKYGAAGNRSWSLFRDAGGTIRFQGIDAGGTRTAISTTVAAAGAWYFVTGRVRRTGADPGVDVFVNREMNTTAVPGMGALVNSSADLRIGATGLGNNSMTGYVSNAFLCAAALNEPTVPTIYEMTRAMYGA